MSNQQQYTKKSARSIQDTIQQSNICIFQLAQSSNSFQEKQQHNDKEINYQHTWYNIAYMISLSLISIKINWRLNVNWTNIKQLATIIQQVEL